MIVLVFTTAQLASLLTELEMTSAAAVQVSGVVVEPAIRIDVMFTTARNLLEQ